MDFAQSTSEVIYVSWKKIVGADFEIQALKVERKSKNHEKSWILRLWESVTQKRLQFFFKVTKSPKYYFILKSTNSFQYNSKCMALE